MNEGEQKPEILVDSDWKNQAQAEKEKLAEAEQQAEAERTEGGGKGELPAADFRGLVGTMASQAIMYLGGMVDPKTGGAMVDLEISRLYIDLLGVVEEKTKGNLTKEEEDELKVVLHELRSRYVEIGQLLAAQMAQHPPTPGAPPTGTSPTAGTGGGSPIIQA